MREQRLPGQHAQQADGDARVARGMSSAEIADELTISPAVAETHVADLLTKLGARDRIQLVIIAYQSGLAGC